MSFPGVEREASPAVDPQRLPAHVAVIMDGNGRWAEAQGLPRTAGHRAGIEAVRSVITAARELGIGTLTLFAFSTENWSRPALEVDFLMSLPQLFLEKELSDLERRNVRVTAVGRLSELPVSTLRAVERAMERTRNNSGLRVNFAINYGGRAELVDVARRLAERAVQKKLDPSQIDEQTFADCLYTRGIPDPDLLIRPSGELRISNFLLWQLAYAELWFSPVLWPDFRQEHFLAAISEYQNRKRRFGRIQS